jgi:hypothetical protein
MIAYLAVQCRDDTGRVGDFLFTPSEGSHKRKAVTPIYNSLCDLYPWLEAKGWKQLPYDPKHPVGVFQHNNP